MDVKDLQDTKEAQDALRSIRHDGDCSCYEVHNTDGAWHECEICDCGALRDKIRSGVFDGNDPLWSAWAAHLCAISQAYRQPVIKT